MVRRIEPSAAVPQAHDVVGHGGRLPVSGLHAAGVLSMEATVLPLAAPGIPPQPVA